MVGIRHFGMGRKEETHHAGNLVGSSASLQVYKLA